MTHSPAFTPEATAKRRQRLKAARLNSSRYQAARSKGLCGWCQCRPSIEGRTYCPRCYVLNQKANRKHCASLPKRKCKLCRRPGHYRKTCDRAGIACIVQRRTGVPCTTCARGDSAGMVR